MASIAASSQTRSSPSRLTLFLGGLAAFAAYFAVYAFRKPFAAGTYNDVADWHVAIDYKAALLVAQIIGYALSKAIGVRVIAEFGRTGRMTLILALLGFAWASLVLFALIPPPWNIACLFLNGLPLGMIWGLVFSYVEGRRASEVLGAMLCASLILSSGVAKSVAVVLLHAGVPEFWMPAVAPIVFLPILLAALWQLERLPAPDADDEAERMARRPMRATDRAEFLRAHGVPLALLVLGYVLLTSLRDFRDNFAAEIWIAMGFASTASVFTASEIPVAVVALAGLAALALVRDNLRALLAIHAVIIGGAMIMGGATLMFQAGFLAPLPWVIATGAGLYLAYTPFNAMLFDRMVAATGTAGNAGFLIYIADASGYVGSIALLLYRNLAAPKMAWLAFFQGCIYVTAIALACLTLASAFSFMRSNRGGAL